MEPAIPVDARDHKPLPDKGCEMAIQRSGEPRGSLSEVQEAIKEVREVYRIGGKILKTCPIKGNYGKKLIQKQAAVHGLNEDLARKARQLADGDRGYTKEELEALFDLCLEHGYVLGISVVHKFLTVPKVNKQRVGFQEEAIKGHWTRSRIAAELRQRFGTRRQGGKKVKIPADLEGALSVMEEWAHHVGLKAKKFAASVKQNAMVPDAEKQLKPIFKALKRAERAANEVSGLAAQARKEPQKRSSRSPSGKRTAKTDGGVAREKKPATASSRSATRKKKTGQRDAGDAAELKEYFELS